MERQEMGRWLGVMGIWLFRKRGASEYGIKGGP